MFNKEYYKNEIAYLVETRIIINILAFIMEVAIFATEEYGIILGIIGFGVFTFMNVFFVKEIITNVKELKKLKEEE